MLKQSHKSTQASVKRQLSTAEFLAENNMTYGRLQEVGNGTKKKLAYRPLDPERVPVGKNNRMPDHVFFNFSFLD